MTSSQQQQYEEYPEASTSSGVAKPIGGGRFDFDDGGTYCGGWEDGKAHGHGVCTGPKGQGEYSGSWHFGFEVSGSYTWPSGSSYEGQWQNGKRHGLGTEYRGRWSYRGEWTQGFKGRYGVRQATASNAKYEGTWANGLQDGYGSETYADAGSFQGQWLRGLRHGYGVRTSAPFGMATHFRPKAPHGGSMQSLKSESGPEPTAERDRRIEDVRGGFVLRARSDEPPARRRSLSERSSNFKDSLLKGLKLRKQRSTGDLDKKGASSIRSTGSSSSWMSTDSAVTSGSHHTDSNASFIVEDEQMEASVTETYMGEWKNDKRGGFGISERSDGLRYEGEWYNNKKYGYGVTSFKDGTREEGKYKNNVLITSQKKKHLFLIRSAKFRERIDAAVNAAQRASKIALQKADIAISRTATARGKGEQADVAAAQARDDSEMSRIIAKQFAPEFQQPGTEILKVRSVTATPDLTKLQQSAAAQVAAAAVAGFSQALRSRPSLQSANLNLNYEPQTPPENNYPSMDTYNQQQIQQENNPYNQQQQQVYPTTNNKPYMNRVPLGPSDPYNDPYSQQQISAQQQPFINVNVNPHQQHQQQQQQYNRMSQQNLNLMMDHNGGGVSSSVSSSSAYNSDRQQQQKLANFINQSNIMAPGIPPRSNSYMSLDQQQQQQQPHTGQFERGRDTTRRSAQQGQGQGRSTSMNPSSSTNSYQQAMSDHFDHYKRPPSRERSVDRFGRATSRTRAMTPEITGHPAIHSRAGSRARTPSLSQGMDNPNNPNPMRMSQTALDAMMTLERGLRGETPSRGRGSPSNMYPLEAPDGSTCLEDVVLRQRGGLGQEIPPVPYTPKRTESMFLKSATPAPSTAPSPGSRGTTPAPSTANRVGGGGGGGGIGVPRRKKSLPDANLLPKATTMMSREEVASLSAAQRQRVLRDHEEAERLRANPLLHLLNPQIQNWFSRQKLVVIVLLINLSLAIMFLQLLS